MSEKSKSGKQSSVLTAQNSRFVSLAPTGQTTFTENGKAIFEIDESLGYIKGRDSYLVAEVINTSADSSRWSFPNGVGASALIDRVDIYSIRTGQHLETLQNWNQWIGIETQYLRDDYESMSLLEGVALPVNQYTNRRHANTRVVTQLDPFLVENNQMSPLKADQKSSQYVARRVTIPLKSGVLGRWWDDERVCPVLNLGGLRVQLTFASNSKVCKRLGFRPERAADPLKGVIRNLGAESTQGLRLTNAAGNTGNTLPFTSLETDDLGYIDATNLSKAGLAIGMRVRVRAVVGGAGAPVFAPTVRTIQDIADSGTQGRINITLNADTDFAAGALTDVRLFVDDTQQNPTYRVDNLELRVLQMALPKEAMEQLGKPMKYEFTSYDHFLSTLPSTSLNHQVPVNSVASKGKAIFSCFVNTGTETNQELMSYYAGDAPSELNMNSQQLFMNNKLYPLNSINPGAKNDKVIVQNELVKAMKAINRVPLNLGSNDGGNLENYSNTFMYSRELARGDYVQDLRNAEPEIRLGFSAGRTNNVKINTFVFSKKVIDISPQGLLVEQ